MVPARRKEKKMKTFDGETIVGWESKGNKVLTLDGYVTTQYCYYKGAAGKIMWKSWNSLDAETIGSIGE
jgi:hypothetical protein